jgi:predicted glycosyltransferase
MFDATLFISEGATMASECAVMGTPAIYVNSMEAGTINDQETRVLLFHYRTSNDVLVKVKELLSIQDLKQQWQKRRDKMLKDKIDVTAFLIWFVENYPDSFAIMKENPDYQLRFK